MAALILASSSPRRRQLLSQVGLTDVEVRVPQVEEDCPPGLTPQETVAFISREKAEAAAALCRPEERFLTADTMVFLDGRRLGKPAHEQEAFSMLSALSGRQHLVCTGVTVGQGARRLTRSETTLVRFRPLTEGEIRRYIASGEPMDKAGAYGIQGLGALLVEGIQGDYFNVMGLPLQLVRQMLLEFGLTLL